MDTTATKDPSAALGAGPNLLSPTKVTVAAFPHERVMLSGDKPILKLSLVGTLHFEDGHSLDSRKVVEIDVSEYLEAYKQECQALVLKRHAPGGDPV